MFFMTSRDKTDENEHNFDIGFSSFSSTEEGDLCNSGSRNVSNENYDNTSRKRRYNREFWCGENEPETEVKKLKHGDHTDVHIREAETLVPNNDTVKSQNDSEARGKENTTQEGVKIEVQPADVLFTERTPEVEKNDCNQCQNLRDVIQMNWSKIKCEIEPRLLLDKLIQASIIDEDGAEEIRTKGHRGKRVDLMLYRIVRLPGDIHRKFKSILLEDYPYLNDTLSMNGQTRRCMEGISETKEDLKQRLECQKSAIIKEVVVEEILDCFLESFVFSVDDHEEVLNGNCRRARAELFFNVLLRTLPQSYIVLCKSLEVANRTHLLSILKSPVTAQEGKESRRNVEAKLEDGEIRYNMSGSLSSTSQNLKLKIELDCMMPKNVEIKIVQQAPESGAEAVQYLRASFQRSLIGSVIIHLHPQTGQVDEELRQTIAGGYLEEYIKALFTKREIIDQFQPGSYKLSLTISKNDVIENEAGTTRKVAVHHVEPKSCIASNRQFLLEEIEPLLLVPLMKAKGKDIFGEIPFESMHNRRQRADAFLKCLETADESAIDTFLDVLVEEELDDVYTCLTNSVHRANYSDLSQQKRNCLMDHFMETVDEIEPIKLHPIIAEKSCLSESFVSSTTDTSKPRKDRSIEFLTAILQSDETTFIAFLDALSSTGQEKLVAKLTSALSPFERGKAASSRRHVKIRHVRDQDRIVFKGNMTLTITDEEAPHSDAGERPYLVNIKPCNTMDKCAQVGAPYVDEELQNNEVIEALMELLTQQKLLSYSIESWIQSKNTKPVSDLVTSERSFDNRKTPKKENLQSSRFLQLMSKGEIDETESVSASSCVSSGIESLSGLAEVDEKEWKSAYNCLSSEFESVVSELDKVIKENEEEWKQSSSIISKQNKLILRLYAEQRNSTRKCNSVLADNVHLTNQINKFRSEFLPSKAKKTF